MAAKPHWTEARAHLAPGPRTSCFIQLLSPSQGNSFSPHSEVAQQTPTRLQGPAQMSLSLSSLPCTLWVRGQGTSLFLTLASLNCGWPFTSVSPAAWRLPVSCITAAQPRAWHVPGEVQEISAGRRLTRRKKQTFAEPLLWARPMPANSGAAEPTLSALEGYLLGPA